MAFVTCVPRFGLDDKDTALLQELAGEVNFVRNDANELSMKVWQREGWLLSGYELHSFTKGAGEAGLKRHSRTIQTIGEEYVVRRNHARNLQYKHDDVDV